MKTLIIDFETTGLDPESNLALELAYLAVDASPTGVTLLDKGQFLFKVDPVEAKRLANGFVQSMHEKSGLWSALEDTEVPKFTAAEIDAAMAEMVTRVWCGDKIMLAGYSVAFDHRWAKHYLPVFSQQLHYHVIDVSSHRKIWTDMAGKPKYPVQPGKAHRAMADCQEVMDELTWYLGQLA